MQPVNFQSERVFQNNFITHQISLIPASSHLNLNEITTLQKYMEDLYVQPDGNTICGKENPSRTYDGLLELLDTMKSSYLRDLQLPTHHPLIMALERVKENITDQATRGESQFFENRDRIKEREKRALLSS